MERQGKKEELSQVGGAEGMQGSAMPRDLAAEPEAKKLEKF